MDANTPSVIDRMQLMVDQWDSENDRRVIFLSCYQMMTANMLQAVADQEFEDPVWVTKLLHDFADYYFTALDAYNSGQPHTPAIWKMTFEAAQRPRTHVLQHLVLGVNAHINYDLVFVIYDILHEEWPQLSAADRQMRYRDHCHVNEIIYQTIDCVQDKVVERYSPAMDIVDKVFLTVDEWLLYRLISKWRDQVWTNAERLMQCSELESADVRQLVEDRSVLRARGLLFDNGVLGLRHVF